LLDLLARPFGLNQLPKRHLGRQARRRPVAKGVNGGPAQHHDPSETTDGRANAKAEKFAARMVTSFGRASGNPGPRLRSPIHAMNSLTTAFTQVKAQLQQPGFSLTGSLTLDPAKRRPKSTVHPYSQPGTERPVPAALRTLYQQAKSISVSWRYQDPAGQRMDIVGYAHLPKLPSIFWQELYSWADGQERDSFFWDDQLPAPWQAELRTYYRFDYIARNIFTLWRPHPADEAGVELALYLGGERLHPLPFTPLAYWETGLALGCMELWQLLFIPEDQQPAYAPALGTLVEQIRAFFPDALPLLPPHTLAYTHALTLPPGPDYRRWVRELTARLQAVPGLYLDPRAQWSTTYTATLATFEQVRWATGQPVPDELRAFYGRLNGCLLRWQWAQQDLTAEPRGGALEFWPLEEVFGGAHVSYRVRWDAAIHDGELWAVGHPARVPGLPQLRPFSRAQNAEEYPCLQLPFPADPAAPVALCWLTGDLDEINPLRLGLTDYLARAFACAGAYKWQYFYRTDGLEYVDFDFAGAINEDLRRLGLDPDQVLPDRRP
jgi:hypothetical protein